MKLSQKWGESGESKNHREQNFGFSIWPARTPVMPRNIGVELFNMGSARVIGRLLLQIPHGGALGWPWGDLWAQKEELWPCTVPCAPSLSFLTSHRQLLQSWNRKALPGTPRI